MRAATWSVVVGLLLAAVTAPTVTLRVMDPQYTETTPVVDLSFLAIGGLIGAGFASGAAAGSSPVGWWLQRFRS